MKPECLSLIRVEPVCENQEVIPTAGSVMWPCQPSSSHPHGGPSGILLQPLLDCGVHHFYEKQLSDVEILHYSEVLF